MLTCDLEKSVLEFVNRLKFNEILKKNKNPLKMKKRIKSGFNEVMKSLKAPNGEK